MSRAILSLNSGSSSIKFGLFVIDGDQIVRAASGKLEKIGIAPRLAVWDETGTTIAERSWPDGQELTHEALLQDLYAWADVHLPHHDIVAVGHRVVHGGNSFVQPVRIDPTIMKELEALAPLAPLHQPHNLAAIRAIARLAPDIPQVACFDTAFHHTMAPVASAFALPRKLAAKGIRRYGFHGISYEYVTRLLRESDPRLAEGKVIIAHLGNGASMCAVENGRSVDTTMGFTALDGLVMGTRCGTLDPGVPLHLIESEGMEPREVQSMLYEESGLLGVSGISSDMRELHSSDDPRAREAIDLFTWRAAREAGALVSSLGGLDGFVFTAGIGENDAKVRAAIAKRLEWTSLRIDDHANRSPSQVISTPESGVKVLVVSTDEEHMIALHTFEALSGIVLAPKSIGRSSDGRST